MTWLVTIEKFKKFNVAYLPYLSETRLIDLLQ